SLLAVPGSATPLRSDSDHAPDFTARVRRKVGTAVYSAGALARNVHVDTATLGNSGRWGGAVAFTGIVPAGKRDDLRFNVNVGNAIGRYQVGAFLPDGYLTADGTLRLAHQASGYAAFRHFWTPALRSTVEYSAANSTPPSGTAAGINKSDRSQHVNLVWSPVAAVNL